LSLIEDILTLSRLDFGEQSLVRTPIPLRPLLEKSLTSLRAKDLKQQITFAIHLPPELETAEIVADAGALKQILFQLLSNAVKFTPDGGTIILDAEQREGQIMIRITDSGIGIDPDQQAQIFENFYQVQGGLVGKTPGTGLGLPIARRLVELHGGILWVESAGPGQGSRFSFSLPIAAPS
jgi:signal transduction histidine kinase